MSLSSFLRRFGSRQSETSSGGISPMKSTLGTLLSSILQVLVTDEKNALLPLVLKFLQAVAANPSQINIALQLAQLEASALAAQGPIETEVLNDLVTLIQAVLQPAPAPAPAPAPVASGALLRRAA
jgi:hypothetical protein